MTSSANRKAEGPREVNLEGLTNFLR
jgi:hypothetical protein